MLELLFSALLQLSLLSDSSATQDSSLSADQQTEVSSTSSTTKPEPDPSYGGGTSWDDNN